MFLDSIYVADVFDEEPTSDYLDEHGLVTVEPREYSRLKFGSDLVARKYGVQLANKYFDERRGLLASKRIIVVPAPYNYVRNAASVMTEHFINQLNKLMIADSGNVVETTLFHRKVTYVNDYGFLPVEQRATLLGNDTFYPNLQYITPDAHLVFIDDIFITGTHREKLLQTMKENNMSNSYDFLFYAAYNGDNPQIEAKLNFAAVETIHDYMSMYANEKCHIIVRPIKWILSQDPEVLEYAATRIGTQGFDLLRQVGKLANAESYHKQSQYQAVLNYIKTI